MSFYERKAADYLRDRFNESIGLCCESIDGESDKFEKTFWLMNDNTLAIVALDRLNETSLRDKIKAKLQTFKVFGHDAFRNLGWVDPFVHRDVSYPDPLRPARSYRWDDSTKSFGTPLERPVEGMGGMGGIVPEEWDGSPPYNDEDQYPDLSASKALSWDKQYVKTRRASDRQKRDSFITRMENLWNSANLGFRKPGQNGNIMETYYLAAYLLVGEKTGWPEPFDVERSKTVKGLLNSLQQGHGGFATKYKVQDGKVVWMEPNGNVETTSLAVYANVRPKDYTAF